MNTILEITPNDPLIARDGRPFGAGQGNRMRGLPWLLPSVVAGSFRTALVKAGSGDFSGDMPDRLMQIAVSGVFPVHNKEIYLPAPNDCVWDDKTGNVDRVRPIELSKGEGGMDFPESELRPVCLTRDQADEDFKAKTPPAWWPLTEYVDWLTSTELKRESNWFTDRFLNAAEQSTRDQLKIDSNTGAAEESQIFSSANLNVTHLPRYGAKQCDLFAERYAEIALTVRVDYGQTGLQLDRLDILHPLGGERRLVHWQNCQSTVSSWTCPGPVQSAFTEATKIRMVLATPAIFNAGWKPDLVNGPLKDFNLRLIGVSNGRWKAVSGWSLAPPRGPKPIRRMVPAGSVYFFTCEKGSAAALAERWLHSVSDDPQAQRDGFGLAIWGTW